MIVTFRCMSCDSMARATIQSGQELRCQCGWTKPIRLEPPASVPHSTTTPPDQQLEHCVVCDNTDLWRQKNFPQWLGFVAVAVAFLLSSVAWYYHHPVWALGVLMAFALLDMILFWILPDVLVCYRCGSRYQGVSVDKHAGFDHELGERYRQEFIRVTEARRR